MKINLFRIGASAALALSVLAVRPAAAEDRVLWISIGDGPTSTSQLNSHIAFAETNNFNAICVLARYRANALYIPNRTDATYTNPEPRFSGSIDTVQYVIDRAHEKGMRVYAAWSVFLVTDGGSTYPAFLPSGSVIWKYEGSGADTTYAPDSGFPRAATTTDTPEGLWSDPGRADVRAYNIEVLKDFVKNYDIDGVILDRIRYPGDESPRSAGAYGYNPTALSDMGQTNPPPGNAAFITARRNAITSFVTTASSSVRAIKPWVIVGATPIVYGSSLGDTYSTVFQHFPSWDSAANAGHVSGFGALDLIAPQYYRSVAATNDSLMGLTNADINETNRMFHMATLPSLDLDGDYSDFAPQLSGAGMATNICDTRSNGMIGYGMFSAVATKTTVTATGNPYMTDLNAASTSCGTNVMGATSALTQYTLKSGWDGVKPNAVTSLAASTATPKEINVSWTAPAAAADSDTATYYLVYRSTSAPVLPYYSNLVSVGTTQTTTTFTDTIANGLVAGSSYYYLVVAVDDYNNKSTSVQVGPASPVIPVSIVESRNGAAARSAPEYQETVGTFANTTSKSGAAGVAETGSRYSTTAGATARFSPTITESGYYHVYVTLDDGTSGANNNAVATWTVDSSAVAGTNNGSGSVTLAPTTVGLANDWLQLTTTPVLFNAGAAGSTGTITFTATTITNRFNMDAVKFEYDSAPPPTRVSDWTLID